MWNAAQSAFKNADVEALRNIHLIVCKEMPIPSEQKSDIETLTDTIKDRTVMLEQDIE